MFYKLTPAYDGAVSPTHVLGSSIVPIVPISIGALSFPTALGFNLATGDPVLAFNFKLSVKVK